AGLLALAHPAASIVPRLRVSLLGAPRQAGGEGVAARPEPGGREGRAESASAASSANPRHLDRPGRDEERATHPPPSAPGPARHPPGPPEPATLAPAAQRREVARGADPGADEGAGASQVAALVTPVQSDLWMLPRSGSAAAPASNPAATAGHGEGATAGA